MKYFVFLCFFILYASHSMAQLDNELDKNAITDELSVEKEEEDVKEDFDSQVFKRNIYGRYSKAKKTINVENKISSTILHPRKDFKDRIKDSLGKY